jgi:hypothetical protein
VIYKCKIVIFTENPCHVIKKVLRRFFVKKRKTIYILHVHEKSAILSTKRTSAQKFGNHKRISRRISQILNDIFG